MKAEALKVTELLADLGRRDIHLNLDGDRLKVNAPEGALTPELKDQLRDRKAEILEFLRTAEAAARQQPAIVPIQPRGTLIPAFGVPGHPGDVFCFSDLVKRLGDDQPFHGLQPPGLDEKSEPMYRVEEIATYFADQIQAFQPKGPYLIVGYCSGGATAYELARELVRRGATVPCLAMFGSPYPPTFRTLPRLLYRVKHWTGRGLVHFREILETPTFAAKWRYLADRWRARLTQVRKENEPLPDDPVLVRRARLSTSAITAVRTYTPPPYAGRVCHFLPNRAWLRSGAAPLKWLAAAPQTEVFYGPDATNGPLMLLEPDAPAFAEFFKKHITMRPTP